jgi:hypothetical protein
MKPEYEARFCRVDVDHVVTQLKAHSAKLRMPRTLMRRIVLSNSDIEAKRGWLQCRFLRITLV